MKDFVLLLPEIFIAVTMLGVVAGEVAYHGERTRLISATALLGLFGAFVQAILSYRYGNTLLLGGSISIDGLSLFFKLFFILLAALSIGISLMSGEIAQGIRSEYVALILAGTIAMNFAAAASDLLLAFLSLFCVQQIGHFLTGYAKQKLVSAEAAMKHLIFGILSSAMFLFGAAILFSRTQSLNLYEIQKILATNPLDAPTALVVFILFLIALATHFAAFPTHLWAADVASGAPTPAAAFVVAGGRAVGFAVAIRLFCVVFVQPGEPGKWSTLAQVRWPEIVAFVSGATMVVGSFMAYRQVAAKRMVAHWAVSQTGLFLMGLLVLDREGLSALLFGLMVELFALLGAFYVLALLFNRVGTDRLDGFRGLFGKLPVECLCLIFFMASLIGLPPTPGFIARFTLLSAALRHNWHFLAAVAILSMGVSTAALARFAYALMGERRDGSSLGESPSFIPPAGGRVVLAVFLVPICAGIVFAERLLGWTAESVRSIFW